MIGYAVAAVILIAAGAILFRRIRDFFRTGGRSACGNCPYAGQCSGGCAQKQNPNKKS